MKIGIITDSFRLGLRESLKKAADLGADGVQIYAVSGEMAPEALDAQARRDLRAYIGDLGLEVSALCGDMGGHAFTRAEDNPKKVERSLRIMDLALDLCDEIVLLSHGVLSRVDKADLDEEGFKEKIIAALQAEEPQGAQEAGHE